MKDVDRAAGNVLRAKFDARLFDDAKYRDPKMVTAFVNNVEHRQLARSAATEGCILLKNVAPPPPPVASNCSAGHFLVGMDWKGDWNQSMVSAANIAECCNACAEVNWCRHFSLTSSSMSCYLKGGAIRELVVDAGVTAGYCTKSSTPPTPPPLPTLPLDKEKIQRVAVVGPNGGGGDAQSAQLGQYECTLDFNNVVPVEEGINNVVGSGIKVDYSVGASWDGPSSRLQLDAAVAVVKAADVAVVVLGDDTSTCGESRDRDNIDLPGGQLDLLQVTTRTTTIVIVVLINCRPATFGAGGPTSKFGTSPNALLDGVGALLVAWNYGIEGGNAIADLLFGNASPSGRLASNWLSTVGSAASTPATWGFARQQSDYDRNWESSNNVDPVLFPFGFGLDYLQVAQKDAPTLTHTAISVSGATTVRISLQNRASMAGGHVVQVYFRQRVSRIARQNLLLANFTKVWLPAKGAVTAEVTVHAAELGYYDSWLGKQTVDTGSINGLYDLFVCSDSSCACGNGNGVPSCLSQLPHATLLIYDESSVHK
jgi:hypothetical protein